jgi:Rhomboid family
MTSGGPDLFVVCKQCRSEVSPYITECPYCGARLRKRAPKLDRAGRVQEPKRRRRGRGRGGAKRTGTSLGRLRPGEIPGIRGDSRPLVTPVVILASLVVMLLWRSTLFSLLDVGIVGKPGGDWWRVFTAPFAYDNTGYAFAVLGTVAIFGWLIERRHGPWIAAVLFLLGGTGGMLVAAGAETFPFALGANGAALALLVAWAIPDVRDLRGGMEIDGDLLGAGVIALVVFLMPAFVPEADWLAGATGIVAGLAVGLPLARLGRG